MAEIPYKPVPTVQPVETGAPKITETVPHLEISGAVGKALEIVGHGTGVLGEAYKEVGESYDKLGKNFKGAGDELWQRAVALRQLELDQNVDKAELSLTQQNSDLVEQARANPNLGREGAAATTKQSMDNRQAHIDGLQTDYEKNAFRKRTMGMITTDTRRLAAHVGDTTRARTLSTAETLIKSISEREAAEDLSDSERAELRQRREAETRNTWGPAKGASPIEVQQKIQDDQDTVRGNQIRNIAIGGHPAEAWRLVQESRNEKNKELYIADAAKRQSLIDEIAKRATDSIELNAAHAATRDPNIGAEEAGRIAANDATMVARDANLPGDMQIQVRNNAENRAISIVTKAKAANEFTQGKDQNDIAKFIHENGLTREDQLSKEQQAQLAGMDFRKQEAIRELLRSPPPDVPVTDENSRRFWQHKAALDGSLGPEARKEAMNVVPLTMKDMPDDYRKRLMTATEEQWKAGVKAQENVPLDDLYHFAKSNSLLTKKMADEKDDVHAQWKGLASIRLRQAISDNKGPLNDAQKREVIYKVNTELVGTKGLKDVPGMAPATDQQLREYRATVPAAKNLSDEELRSRIQNWILRERYRLIDEATKTGKMAPSGKPAPNVLSPTPLSNQ